MPTSGSQLNVSMDSSKRSNFRDKVRLEGRTVADVINTLVDMYLYDDLKTCTHKCDQETTGELYQQQSDILDVTQLPTLDAETLRCYMEAMEYFKRSSNQRIVVLLKTHLQQLLKITVDEYVKRMTY